MPAHLRCLRKLNALCREIARVYRQAGALGFFKRACHELMREARDAASFRRCQPHPFDVEFGTDTSGIIEPGALDLPPDRVDDAVRYQTAIVEVFTGLLNELDIVWEDYVFIDLGSGKGRALLLASRLPFKEIIGVELSATLHRVACRNIQVFRDERQRCHRIRSVCQDAASFEFPSENAVIYLFNPFGESVIREVLSRIEDSLRRFPRTLYILYLKPVHRHVFDELRCFQVLKTTERYVIYESRRAAST
jgi:SAM-dependent methyltransferase